MHRKIILLVSLVFFLGCSNNNSRNKIEKKDIQIDTKMKPKIC